MTQKRFLPEKVVQRFVKESELFIGLREEFVSIGKHWSKEFAKWLKEEVECPELTQLRKVLTESSPERKKLLGLLGDTSPSQAEEVNRTRGYCEFCGGSGKIQRVLSPEFWSEEK